MKVFMLIVICFVTSSCAINMATLNENLIESDDKAVVITSVAPRHVESKYVSFFEKLSNRKIPLNVSRIDGLFIVDFSEMFLDRPLTNDFEVRTNPGNHIVAAEYYDGNLLREYSIEIHAEPGNKYFVEFIADRGGWASILDEQITIKPIVYNLSKEKYVEWSFISDHASY